MARSPDRRLLSLLSSQAPHISSLALAVREVVLEEAPKALESFSKGYAVAIAFSFTGKPLKDGFCHVVAYDTHVNLGFNRGALLPDPDHILTGTGKRIRHITIHNEQDLEKSFVRSWSVGGGTPCSFEAAIRSTSDRVSRAKAV